MSMAKNTIVNVAGSVIPLAVAIFTVPLYLGLIGEERYGVLAVIWVLLGYFGVFDLGLGKATARRMAKINSDTERSHLFWTVLILTMLLGVVGGVVLMLSSEWLLVHVFTLGEEKTREALDSILWLPLGLTLLLLNSAMQGTLQARERFISINAVGVFGDSMAQIFPLFVAWLGYVNIDALLPAALGARFLTSVLLFIQCKKHVPLSNNPKVDISHVRPLLSYGGWACTLTMIGPLMVVLDRMVIAAIAGAKGVTYYTIPYNLVTKLSILPNSFGSVLFPKLAALPKDKSRALADQAACITIACMTPIIIITMGILPYFLTWWLGPVLAERCAGIGELLLLGVWLSGMVMSHSYLLYAEATLKRKILIVTLLEIPIYFGMLWVGLKYFGVAGAAGAWSLRIFIDAIFILTLAKVLRKILFFAFPSMVLVLVAGLTLLVFDVSVLWRLVIICCLLVLSILMHWKLYLNGYRLFISRRAT